MKTPFLCALAAAFLVSALPANAERLSSELAAGWKFLCQPASLTTSTAGWEAVQVPHTWNARDVQTNVPQEGKKWSEQDADDGKAYHRGEAWYARSLVIPKEWQGKRVFVRFEAASIVAKSYVNGTLLGEHRGAFTAFCYEITPLVRFGGENELRVQVDNACHADVPPISGDFNMSGGIYRPVHLIVTDPVCITPLDRASSGVYLTQKSLTDTKATVEVKALISNGPARPAATTGDVEADARKASVVRVETEIQDAEGKTVATETREVQIFPGQTVPVAPVLTITNPHRWNGRIDPYLYTAVVRIHRGGAIADEVRQPLGLRTVAISEKEGFLLNGKPYPIHGVNRHQECQDLGWALSPSHHEQDARLILDMGTTAVRNAHYPQSAFWHDLADHSGLLLWDEVSLVDKIEGTPAFADNAELQLRELMAQLSNHPSIAFWGIFNELARRKTAPPDELIYRLKAVIQQTDPSRPIVAATCIYDQSFNQAADHTAINRYPGWYSEKIEDLQEQIARMSAEIGKRTALSEYGAGANPAQHQEGELTPVKPGGPWHPEEYQTAFHEKTWAQINGNPQLWGSFVWVMFDFASASRNEGSAPLLNDKGLVTHDRKIRKDAYFFYKANWNPEPMVYIAERRMSPRKMAATEVKAYTTAPEAELKVNGKSLGTAKADVFHICRWENVTLAPGRNTIEAAATAGGKPIADQCEWVLDTQAANAK